MSSTDPPMRANASRVRSTTVAPWRVRAAPSWTTATVWVVRCWMEAISWEISAAACWLSSASLRTSSGDDGEATALVAGAGGLDRGVEGEQVGLFGDAGDGGDDRADLLGFGGQLLDRGGHRR